MGLKDTILGLRSPFDWPITVTELIHQIFSVDGFKKKQLKLLIDTFTPFGLTVMLDYRMAEEWDMRKAGQLSSHLDTPATIPLRLVPTRGDQADNFVIPSTEIAISAGSAFLRNDAENIKRQIPDDFAGVCEFFGRLSTYYRTENWKWHICQRAGTTLNIHLMPASPIEPVFFLRAQYDCKIARINHISICPHTIEIVFFAASKIARLPYNKRKSRLAPY